MNRIRVTWIGGGGVATAKLDGLHPGWTYTFRIRAHNGNGPGIFGQPSSVRLLDPGR